MQIKPKTEQEIQEEGLFKAGVYPFEVVKAEDKQSKAGNEMIELNLRVFGAGDQTTFVRDFLLESMAHKLRHAVVKMLGEDVYNSGSFSAADFKGREGWVKIGIEKGKDAFPDKNRVIDYVDEPQPEAAGVATNAEDDIPW